MIPLKPTPDLKPVENDDDFPGTFIEEPTYDPSNPKPDHKPPVIVKK